MLCLGCIRCRLICYRVSCVRSRRFGVFTVVSAFRRNLVFFSISSDCVYSNLISDSAIISFLPMHEYTSASVCMSAQHFSFLLSVHRYLLAVFSILSWRKALDSFKTHMLLKEVALSIGILTADFIFSSIFNYCWRPVHFIHFICLCLSRTYAPRKILLREQSSYVLYWWKRFHVRFTPLFLYLFRKTRRSQPLKHVLGKFWTFKD